MIRLSHFAYDEKQWAPLSEVPFTLPLIQAHRGLWIQGAPQNSLESVLAAQSKGYQMVEVDLRLTQDQQVVLFHDSAVFHVDQSLPISKITLKELQQILPVTSLQQLLDSTDKKLILNLEIKNETRTQFGLEEKVIEILKKSPHRSRVMFSSFNPFSLAWMAQLVPEIPRGLLVSQERSTPLLARELLFLSVAKPHYLHARWEDLDHYRDLPSSRKVIWTLNDLDFAKTIQANRRVASIISDQIPPQALTS